MKKTPLIAVSTTILALFTSSLSYAAPAGITHETVKDRDGIKTAFHLEQGLSFTLIEPPIFPSASAFLGGNFNWGNSYILLNKFDIDMIIGGSGLTLEGAICAIPFVGWAACRMSAIIILAATTNLTNRVSNPCGHKQMKIYFSGRFGGCV